MIVYNDVLQKLAAHGYSAYKLHKGKLIQNGTLDRIRRGQSVSTSTIDVICRLLNCQPGDVIRYEPSDTQGK